MGKYYSKRSPLVTQSTLRPFKCCSLLFQRITYGTLKLRLDFLNYRVIV